MFWRSYILCALTLALTGGDVWALGPKLRVPDAKEWFTAPKAGVVADDLAGITAERIQREWAPRAAPIQQAQRACADRGVWSTECQAPLNLSVLLQLNLRAADLWSRIVDCNGGAAEKARQNYFEAQRLCDGDANASLVTELKALARNFQDFLITSPYYRERGEGTLYLPVLHPLLAELATEAVSAALYLIQQGSWSTIAGTYLLPAGKIEISIQLMMCEIGTANNKKNYELCYRDGQYAPNYWSRTYLNAIRILSAPTTSSRDCSRFGLWPNAALIASSTMIGTSLQSTISRERGDPFIRNAQTENREMPSCWIGSQEIAYKMSSVWPLPYNGNVMDVLSQHTHFVANVLGEYVRMREAWLN